MTPRSARLRSMFLVLAATTALALPAWAQQPKTSSESRNDHTAAAPVGSRNPSPEPDSVTLQLLLRQVRELQAQVAELQAALHGEVRTASPGETPAIAPPDVATAVPARHVPGAGASTTDAAAAPIQALPVPDETVHVAVGGYGSFRLDATDSADLADSLTLRRFVLTTDARYGDRLQVYSEIEFERLSEIEVERSVSRQAGGLAFKQAIEGANGSEIAVEQAWGQFNFGRGLGLRFGAVLPPVGRFNLMHDDDRWNYPRRPLIDRGANVLPAKGAWTEMGIGVVGEIPLGDQALLSYQAYALNGTILDFALEQKLQTRVPKRNKLELEAEIGPTQGAFDGSNPLDAFAARVQLSPRLGTELAVSAYHGQYTPGYLSTTGSITTLGLDGAHRAGPLQLEGEYLYTRYGNVDAVLREFAAAAVDKSTETESGETAALESEIELDLGGLSRSRRGFWLDLGVPLDMRPGFLGLDDAVLIPSIRYERVWFNEDLAQFAFSGGSVTRLEKADREQDRWLVGFAFRPVPTAVFHLFYERNHALQGLLIDPGVPTRTTNGFTFGLAMGF